MITITPDPNNPEKLILTATTTLWLDRVLLESLSDEIGKAVRQKAIEDLNTRGVQKELRNLVTQYLAKLLGVTDAPKDK